MKFLAIGKLYPITVHQANYDFTTTTWCAREQQKRGKQIFGKLFFSSFYYFLILLEILKRAWSLEAK
jgi:hypothetical protein